MNASSNDNPFARLQHLGRRVDGAEGALLAARTSVIGAFRLPIHVVGLRELECFSQDGNSVPSGSLEFDATAATPASRNRARKK
jgi:hypothetical protein